MRTKLFFYLFLFTPCFFFARRVYVYFTRTTSPLVLLAGLSNEQYYKGIVECSLQASNNYPVGQVSLLLDSKPFDFGHPSKIEAYAFNIPFILDTTQLTNGKHTFVLEAHDSSYNKNKFCKTISFSVDNIPLNASLVDQTYTTLQGRTIHVKINSNKKLKKAQLTLLSKEYDCCPLKPHSTTYECFIPIDCEEDFGEYILSAHLEDVPENIVHLTAKVSIKECNFPKAKIFQIDSSKLKEEKEISVSNKILEETLEKQLNESPHKKLWAGIFELPTEVQRISTPFGEIRITPEKGRYLHKAIDIANKPNSVVWASQNGRIIIKDRYLMSGNTVVIDHGLGVFTQYYHLDDFADIEVGDFVKKGNPIGKIGKTGYATGYHLHWELRVNNVAVDPLQWTEKTF